jgi:hypothetical protein
MIDDDRVNHPQHYTWLKDVCWIETIDITRHMGFNLGNAIKYLLRSWRKAEQGINDIDKEIEDLQKSIRYINDYINSILIPMRDKTLEPPANDK